MATTRGKAMVPTLLAAAGIVAGLFGPIVRVGADVERIGDLSVRPTYYGFFQTQGIVLMVLAAVALILVFRGMGRLLWACAAGVWITLLWEVIQGAMMPEDDSPLGKLTDAISSEVSKYASERLGGVLFDFTSLSWGGVLLLAGALLMIWAAIKGR